VYYAEVSAGYWLKVFSLELGTGAWIQKKNSKDGATGSRKKFDDIYSLLYTIHERDRQTDDGQTDRHRKTAYA